MKFTENKVVWYLLQQLSKVWVRVVGLALLAIFSVFVAKIVASYIPSSWTIKIGADSVEQILGILAASMLTVTTFSLAIAVSAFVAAATTATPRATPLLQKDATAQNVLAIFLGAFLFSLIGLIALQGGYYTSNGRLVLFITTGFVILAVIIAIIRWISHLMIFGRMGDTLDRVEVATTNALDIRLENPYLGANPLLCNIPRGYSHLPSHKIGYVQYIDVKSLNSCAKQLGIEIWLNAIPGTFVHLASPLFYINKPLTDETYIKRFQSAFTISGERNFKQDPRFGLIVLSEIASRALSPAVNDPGTAIDVIGRLVRILSRWIKKPEPKVEFDAIFAPPISSIDMIEDAFRPIARDGAAIIEVQLRLQKGLLALSKTAPVFSKAAEEMAYEARIRAKKHLLEKEQQQLAGVSF